MNLTEDIIIAAISGDLKAYEKIYQAFAPFVFNVALRIIRNRSDTEDLVQELFIKLFYKLRFFKREAKLKTYIYRMAVNMSLNMLKKKNREDKRHVTLSKVENFISIKDSNSTVSIQKKIVELAISRLPQKYRVCFILRQLEDCSYDEIANILNININTVKSRLARARQYFLVELETVKKEVGYEM